MFHPVADVCRWTGNRNDDHNVIFEVRYIDIFPVDTLKLETCYTCFDHFAAFVPNKRIEATSNHLGKKSSKSINNIKEI